MLATILACQAQLIAALDAGDADSILETSAALQEALTALKTGKGDTARNQIELALKQTEAARIRVKYLTAWNRQKIDRMANLRGHVSLETYGNPARTR